MAILQTLVASSALALALLAAAPSPANALVTAGNNHLARHHGVSPAHEGIAKRKRNTHKNRKRCVQPPANDPTTTSPGTSDPPYTPPADTTTQPPSTNPPGNNGGYAGGGKVGLAWAPDVASDYIRNAVTSGTGYYYNWSPWEPGVDTSGARFAPMFWGDVQSNGWSKSSEFHNLIVNGNKNYGVALGMNEVNQDGQAKMDVYEGARQWRANLLPLRNKGYRLGSPSTTNDESPGNSGPDWMGNFYNQLAPNEYPDFNCIHWYGIGIDNFKSYVTRFHDRFPQNIWITEFACTAFGSNEPCDVFSFTKQATDWLDSQSYVEAYFMFGFVDNLYGVSEANRLIRPWDGGLTDLGWVYVN